MVDYNKLYIIKQDYRTLIICVFLHSDFSDAKARALYNIGRAHSMMGDYEKGLEL